jgi:predicted lipase
MDLNSDLIRRATSQTVLDQVTALMTANKVNKILITGHSLGAAISSLQAAFLKEKIGNTAEITVRGYGLPRVGNLEWAWVSSCLAEVKKH